MAGGLPCQLCSKPPPMSGIALSLSYSSSAPRRPLKIKTTHCVLTACARAPRGARASERVEGQKGVGNEGSFAQNQIKSSIGRLRARKIKRGRGGGGASPATAWQKKSGRASDAAEPSEKSQDKRLPLLFEMQPVAYLHHESLLG